MDEKRIKEILERFHKTTGGEWKSFSTHVFSVGVGNICSASSPYKSKIIEYARPDFGDGERDIQEAARNAEFIAHSRHDILDLIEEVTRLQNILLQVAEWAYQSEVIDTGMADEIGPGQEYYDKEDWIETWMAQWEDETS